MIPFDLLWEQYKRIIKPNGAIALFGSQPFTSALVMSNPKWFKYEWIWDKVSPSGHLNAKIKPMLRHENILIFSEASLKQLPYNPIFTKGRFRNKSPKRSTDLAQNRAYGIVNHTKDNFNDIYYPTSICRFSVANRQQKLHPTEKNVGIIEYLIKTYTLEGELILDNTAGSGTLAIAAINTNRQYICIEKDPHYFEVMRDRIANHDPNAPIKTKKPPKVPKGQLTLFN